MDEIFVKALLLVLSILLGALVTYFKTNAELRCKVGSYIANAEDEYADVTKSGGQKFEWVVEQLYNLVPVFLKPVFTKEMISNIVQTAFDAIQQYAKSQLDKKLSSKD